MIPQSNNADNYEQIMVTIDPIKQPILFANRVKSLLDSGCTQEMAEKVAIEPIELELYYDPECGLFGIEAEAVESITEFHNPYTGALIECYED